jgi:hypothetical protein
MALGFQDCCNTSSYFYLNGIPATVSEFETYYIITSQGEKFCATYLDVPSLNYLPPTYNLLEMTQFVDCDDCKTSNDYTCPTSELILISQVSAGSIAGSDCSIATIMPLYVECVSVDPTFASLSNGSVSLYVTGGTPPYTFFSGGTTNAVGNNQSTNNVYPIFQNLPFGTYNIDVTDSNGDFLISVSCVLDSTPPDLTVSCVPTNVSIFGANDGSINLNVNGGTPPYTYKYLGSTISLPLQNLTEGTYEITVTDSGVGGNKQIQIITCEVTQPNEVDYPDFLCMKFTACGTPFTLQFERDITDINYRASYICNNPEVFGITTGLSLYYGDNGWRVTYSTLTSQPFFSSNCGISFIGLSFNPSAVFATSSLPIGSWNPNGGALYSSTVIVTAGICPVTASLQSTESVCLLTPNLLSTTIVTANGGTPPYTYNVYNNFTNQLSPSPIFSLAAGSYTLVATDSLGAVSQPSSIFVPSTAGTDVLFGINNCSVGTVSVITVNQLNTSPQIDDGESRKLTADVTTTVFFDYLPDGAEFTGKIKISLSSLYISGKGNQRYPDSANILVTPTLTLTRIITNNVTTNFMNGVTPEFTVENYPAYAGTNGKWYNVAQGGQCCLPLQGLKWTQDEYWISPTLTFNNTTNVKVTLNLVTQSKIPLLPGICAKTVCGAFLQNSMSVVLQDLDVVTGCLNVNGTKELMGFSVKNNSNGDGGWEIPPVFC